MRPPGALADAPPRFIRQWGGYGQGYGTFTLPQDLACASDGTLYVCDPSNPGGSFPGLIQHFASDGQFLGQVSYPRPYALGWSGTPCSSGSMAIVTDSPPPYQGPRVAYNGILIGALGTGDGQFLNIPSDVAVDFNGNVWVADADDERIQVFTASGGYLFKIPGIANGLACDPASRRIYATGLAP